MTYNLSAGQYTAQDDIIDTEWETIFNGGEAYTLDGNDKIIGHGYSSGVYSSSGLYNDYNATIDTGNGRDTITGVAWSDYWGPSIWNLGSIKTGNDEDYISTYKYISYGYPNYGYTKYGAFANEGMVSLGDGNDVLDAMVNVASVPYDHAIWNSGTIEAGNGHDTILSNTTIYNDNLIDTGNGNDFILTEKGFHGSGNVFLGDGEDYLKGFGSGYYEGGNDQDSLALTSGSYTIGIGGADVSFTGTRDNQPIVMQTSGFEKLIVTNGTYDFTSLYDGMTVFVW
jgi:hypothetical protein